MSSRRRVRHGIVLPLPLDDRLSRLRYSYRPRRMTRSSWLRDVETVLAEHYPHASRADLNTTARSLAPFPLKLGAYVA